MGHFWVDPVENIHTKTGTRASFKLMIANYGTKHDQRENRKIDIEKQNGSRAEKGQEENRCTVAVGEQNARLVFRDYAKQNVTLLSEQKGQSHFLSGT